MRRLLPAAAAARADYYVYCANGTIEVESRSPEQMRIARGSGGPGRPCSCR